MFRLYGEVMHNILQYVFIQMFSMPKYITETETTVEFNNSI